MTPLDKFSAALHLSLGLSAIFFLLFKLCRDYREDALRDRLFALRERLFDYAAAGEVPFNHPAYTKLRILMNGLIRFAHRLTFMRFFMGLLFRAFQNDPCPENPLLEWSKALETLPPESCNRLKQLHGQMLVVIVKHLVTGSPIMLIFLLMFSVWSVMNGLAQRLLESHRLLETITMQLPGLDTLELQVARADALERQSEEVLV